MNSLSQRVIISECSSRRYFSPSGELILETNYPPHTVYMVQREEFDRELGRQAALAGVDIHLNTKVTGLFKDQGVISGVTTSSREMPVVFGKVVIVASGTRGRLSGIPKQELMSYPGETAFGGFLVELVGISDIEAGVLETYLGEVSDRGTNVLWTCNENSGFLGFTDMSWYARLMRGDSFVSQKLEKARPVQILGSTSGSECGRLLKRVVASNLMLVGDAAGFNSIVHAIVTGRYAGEVATVAISKGDTSEKSLTRYTDLFKEKGLHRVTLSWTQGMASLRVCSNREIEEMIPDLLARSEIKYRDVWEF
jgi:flavin-dependent dehydrogenase